MSQRGKELNRAEEKYLESISKDNFSFWCSYWSRDDLIRWLDKLWQDRQAKKAKLERNENKKKKLPS